ncbi:TM2 domain-containing protein [Shewanella intestini]|uniref:TM2 domain-containing protein n=1 Tax=Shewanella intestini TaxID=2017544 RepID=A0ABS5I4Z6_9GAMM|nr:MULTISPECIES: TM2 domain-containing protein [Shewanella]MBR9729102.1 TM2 domain-containing protein [Shewanella intestini]MRG37178.1 NINE protein [Shewanella sp. XMDDZSB0408]
MHTQTCPQCSHHIHTSSCTCTECDTAIGLDALSGMDPHIRNRNQKLAVWFGVVLGVFGAHKFYLGQHSKGWLYLLFSWTLVPMVMGWIDSFNTMKMSAFSFEQRYARRVSLQ